MVERPEAGTAALLHFAPTGVGMDFRILGPLAVERDGTTLDLGAPKQRAVLAFLAAHAGEPVSLDRLIEELWGDQAPPRATASLQAYVSNLRRVIEPGRPVRTPATILVTRPPGYALDLPDGSLDADRFEDLSARAARALADGDAAGALTMADDALDLWRGEVLADFPYEPFAEAVRQRLGERRMQVLELRADALMATGRSADAALELEGLTRRHPFREHLWELLMLALYRSGRQADALTAFGDARRVLTEELGLDPGPALRRLEQQILAHDPSLDLRPPDDPAPTPGRGGRAPAPVGGNDAPAAPPAVAAVAEAALVGRTEELAALQAAWSAASRGLPRFAVVAGEPGIGKTAVAQALVAGLEAEPSGAAVAWGRNHEQAGSAPLWPWVQVVRALLSATDADERDLPAEVEAILEAIVHGAATGTDDGDVDAARLRLFDAVARLLAAVSVDRPVLVVLDDVQWADVDSLRLLDYLTTEMADGRVLVLVTHREEDARPGTPLAGALGGLARRPDTVRVSLQGLSSSEVGRYAARLAGLDLAPATVELLLGRTSGNPFFVGEMVRLLAAERRLRPEDVAGLEVPSGVRDVVRRRVDRLPDDSQAVLRVAAVMGREFTVDELAAACDLDVDRLLDALDPPLVTALVEEVGGRGERFRFSHALVGETLADDLSATRRRRLHLRIGQALETVHARDLDRQYSRLAHHFAEAAALGHAGTATRYAVLAARHAHQRFALDEAARLWRLAHTVAVLDDDADPRTVLEITIELASALARVGDREARERSVEAMDRALALGDGDAAVRAATSLTEHAMTWLSADFRDPEDEVVERLDRVLDLLGRGDSLARARVLSVRAPLGYYRDVQAANEIVDDALAIARRLDDDDLLANCLVQRLCVHHSDARAVLDCAEELLAVADRLGSTQLEITGLVSRMRARFALGDVDGADADAALAAERLQRHPAPLSELQLGYYPVMRLLLDGRFREADEVARSVEQLGQRVSMWGDERYLIQMLDVRFFEGRLAELEPVVDLLALTPRTGARNFAVLLRFESGRPDEAADLLAGWGGIEAPRDDWRFPAEAVAATLVAHHAGDAAVAADLYRRLLPLEGQLANSGDLNCEGPVDTYLGLLALTMGDRDLARRHLEGAVGLAVRIGSPTFEGHGRLHLAATLDGDQRRAQLDRALVLAEAIGMDRIARQARAELAKGAPGPG